MAYAISHLSRQQRRTSRGDDPRTVAVGRGVLTEPGVGTTRLSTYRIIAEPVIRIAVVRPP
jgi:hypothetical protein